MPEFDTYQGIERFARNPKDPAAILAFDWLRHRAYAHITWNSLGRYSLDGLELGCSLFTGSYGRTKKKVDASFDLKDMAKMSKDKRDELFMALCNQVGVSVDPDALSKEKQ